MNTKLHSGQRGATLVIALVLLLIVTLLAVANMREVALEERVVGNLRDAQTALNGAESALRVAEVKLATNLVPPTVTNSCPTNEFCVQPSQLAASQMAKSKWSDWSAIGVAYPTDTTLANTAAAPRWYLSFLSFDPPNSAGYVEVSNTEERSRGVGPYYYSAVGASPGRTTRTLSVLETVTVQRY